MSKKAKMDGRRHHAPWLKNEGTVKFILNGEAEVAFKKWNDAICKSPMLALHEKGVSTCCILMTANMQSELYYDRSNKMERTESLPFAAGSLRVQNHDTLHTTENSKPFLM